MRQPTPEEIRTWSESSYLPAGFVQDFETFEDAHEAMFQGVAKRLVESSVPHQGPFPFSYFGDLDLGVTWAMTFSYAEASGDIYDQAKFRVAKEELETQFPDDVRVENFGGFYGPVDHLMVRVLDTEGRVTEVGREAITLLKEIDMNDAVSDLVWDLEYEHAEDRIAYFVKSGDWDTEDDLISELSALGPFSMLPYLDSDDSSAYLSLLQEKAEAWNQS